MLCAERLCELPLEVRIHVANMDIEAYIRMYLWDDEFREYARGVYAVDDFIERFVVTDLGVRKRYELGNIKCHKYKDGGQLWYLNGQYHRTNGPAILSKNNEEWYVNGKLHRIDGPARITNDCIEYWQNGIMHREDGYAVKNKYGKFWYINGVLHNTAGPAIIRSNGEEYWFINGRDYNYLVNIFYYIKSYCI